MRVCPSQVLDANDVNVAVGKPVNGSDMFVSANPANVISLACGVNGAIDQAAVPLDLVHSASQTGNGWWQVNLQVSFGIVDL